MINIVVCGLGNISKRVAQGIQYAKSANLYGICSRSKEKANIWNQDFQVKNIFSSYEEVYTDSNVDLLYLCTPNTTHYDLIKEALMHHKSVICEKPMVDSIEKINELFELAQTNKCFLMEAQKTYFSPLLDLVLENMDLIGELKHIDASYCWDIRPYLSDRWLFQEGGGCAGDIGVYPICGAYKMASSSPSNIQFLTKKYSTYPVDFLYEAFITFNNGISATIHSNWFENRENKGTMYLFGTKGTIEIPAFWKGKKAYIHAEKEIILEVQFESEFTAEIEHAAYCIESNLSQSPILSKKKTIEILQAYKKVII